MDRNRNELEIFWDGILSENRADIIAAYMSVTPDEQQRCLDHLRIMLTEEGWLEGQRRAANFALKTLEQNES